MKQILHPVVRRALLALAMTAAAGAAQADPAAAGRYYEDGLARFEGRDVAGAIIQLKNALQQDRDMLAAHLLLGRAYLGEGDVGPAEVAFREALRLGVNRAEVAVPLAQIYLLQGKPAKLVDTIPAEGLPPAVRLEVLTLRGTAFAALGKPVEAEHAFAEARAVDPASPLPLVAEVPMLLAAGQLDRARERAAEAVRLGPEHAGAYNGRASVAHAAGDLASALGDYERAIALQPAFVDARVARAGVLIDLGRDADAQQELDRFAAGGPVEPRVAYLRALLAGRRGDAQAVARHLEEVARLVDALPAEWIAGQEQLLMAAALAHHAGRQYEKARRYLEVLVSRYPRNLGARKLLAAVWIESGDPARAAGLLEHVLRIAPDDAQALLLFGRVQMALKRYARASELFERAAALGGGGPALDASLGFSRLARGEAAAALPELQRAFAAVPGDLGLASALAHLHMRGGDPAAALDVARRAAAALAGNPAALNLLGAISAAAGDRAGARAAYAEALAREPGFLPARLNHARLDAAEGRFDEARATYAEMLAKNRRDATVMYESGLLEAQAGRAQEAQRWFEKAAAERPADARIGLALIDARMGAGDRPGALEAARALAARRSGDLAVLGTLARTEIEAGDVKAAQHTLREMTRLAQFDADMQVRIGYLQLAAGNPEGADYSAQKALNGRPGDEAALVLAAETAMLRGDLGEAQALARKLREQHPDSVAGMRLLGDAALRAGNAQEAEQAYHAAFERQASADLLLRRVRALMAQGRRAQAVAALDAWLQRERGDVPVRQALAELHMRAADWGAAAREYETLIGDGVHSANVYNNYALVLLEQGDARALEMAQRAHALAPADAAVLDTYGWILARAGRKEEGLRYLREARLREPGHRDIRYHLAKVLHETGRSAEARAELGGMEAAADVSPEIRRFLREIGSGN